MANMCILRTRKLKTDGNVGASLAHAFRERETPNADPARTPKNQHIGAKSSAEAMARYRTLLPDTVRKNGVRCIEYLITASPEALKDPKASVDYYNAAINWLREKHGKNLFYVGMHYDEKTPHMYAYAVPIDNRGRLNCRHFLGGREKLSALQDDFHAKVGRPSGLERGIKGSRARHQAVKQFYSRISEDSRAKLPTIEIPKPPQFGVFYDLDHWQKCVQSDIEQAIKPRLEQAQAKAIAADLAIDQTKGLRREIARKKAENESLQQTIDSLQHALKTLPIDVLLEQLEVLRKPKVQEKPQENLENIEKKEPNRGRSR